MASCKNQLFMKHYSKFLVSEEKGRGEFSIYGKLQNFNHAGENFLNGNSIF